MANYEVWLDRQTVDPRIAAIQGIEAETVLNNADSYSFMNGRYVVGTFMKRHVVAVFNTDLIEKKR